MVDSMSNNDGRIATALNLAPGSGSAPAGDGGHFSSRAETLLVAGCKTAR